MFGLSEKDLAEIKSILSNFHEVEQAKIFGSRAKGNYKNGSDIDIALIGKLMTNEIALKISGILNEDTIMPYHFDVLAYNRIKNLDLIQHINRVGILFYKN